MRNDIKFYRVFRVVEGCRPQGVTFGVGVDRSLWMPARLANLQAEAMEEIQRKHGPQVFVKSCDGEVYVESRAVVLNCPEPIEQETMVATMRDLAERLRPIKISNESTRNN